MKIEEILDEYLGKQTKVALMELPNIAKELSYHFDCERAFYNRYSDDYTHIVGYILDKENRTVTLYSGFFRLFLWLF